MCQNETKLELAKSAHEFSRETIYHNESSLINNQETESKKRLTIYHFNDVYNIESGKLEPKAGAARFLTALNYLNHDEPGIVLFSGDALGPSLISYVSKGRHMIPVLNSFNIKAACIGNHDFDFGIGCLTEVIKETNFPWLISNVCDVQTKKPLADAKTKHIFEYDGLKIGIIGLVEKEWIDTISTIDHSHIIYEPFIQVGRELAQELRNKDKVDLVIALTHMRSPNDVHLANEVAEIDLILGGHDHHYFHQFVSDKKWVIKSGTDFRDLSVIKTELTDENGFSVFKLERIIVDSKIKEDEELKKVIDEYAHLSENFDQVLGNFKVDLDGRFSIIRSMESNLANFFCDVVLDTLQADCVFLNSGTFRCDCIMPSGAFTISELKKILPANNELVLIKCTGQILYESLENGVSQYPKLEGRFPQVSGIEFCFDPSKPSMNRIDFKSIKIKGENLDLNKEYKVGTKLFLALGKDGYQMLTKSELISDEELQLFFVIEQYLNRIQRYEAETLDCQKEIEDDSRQKKLIKDREKVEKAEFENELLYGELFKKLSQMKPKVEGRIRIIS